MENFHPLNHYNEDKFSSYYYMVINHDEHPSAYYYANPVYVLMNEQSFSAASVFAGVVKELGNITLVGIGTDGSSGLSKKYFFNASGIQVKLSHMISFQRDGTLFDGHGTVPDIFIERSLNQILGREDYQLNQLLIIAQSEY